MPYHEVKDPFQTAQDVLFEQLRKAGAEKQRQEREQQQQQTMNDYLREQVQNYNNGVDPADNETGYGTEKTNKEVQDSMNEKLDDKGISVDNVDTKHVSDDTQDMTLVNRPTTDDKVKDSMNEKFADKGITVDNVNTNHVSNAEHVTMDRSQSKTDTVGTGTATTSGQPDKKLPTQPKTSDSPLGDSNTMSKMKTSTSMNSTSPDTPSVESSAPKSNVRTSNETATPKTETTKEQNESIQKTMNEKLSDKGIKVGEVNSGATAGKEANPVKNVTPPKTEQKRFKDDSGYVTKTVPNEPSATIVQKDAGTARGAVGESFSGTKTTELPKNNVNADKAGLIGLKNSKSFKK